MPKARVGPGEERVSDKENIKEKHHHLDPVLGDKPDISSTDN